MIRNDSRKSEWREGMIAGLPIVIGYIPIAMAFGMLAKTTGISMMDSFLFSAIVFAGASQFMALSLLSVGAGMGEIILTTLLVNLRHLLMSASLATKIEKEAKKWIPFISFGVTDETFLATSFKEGQVTKTFMLGLQLVSYCAWVGGTVLGYWAGKLLPEIMQNSMQIALYAMFAAILIPEAKKSYKVVVLALFAGLLNTFFTYFQFFPKGWNIVLSIIFVSAVGAYFDKEERVKPCE